MSFSIMPPRRLSAAVTLPPKKRRRVSHNTEEIIFNVEEREDYLSGFHKRKVQRQKQAKAEALKREREEKLAARKHLREERKADLEKHMEAVNAVLRDNGEVEPDASLTQGEGGSRGIDNQLKEIDGEEEYADEDKFTTVTVEAVDVDRDGFKRVFDNLQEDKEEIENVGSDKRLSEDAPDGQAPRRDTDGKRTWSKTGARSSNSQAKKRQFKYETKAERKITRYKERGKGKKQAKVRKSR